MSSRWAIRRSSGLVSVLAAAAVVLSACGSGDYAATPLPTPQPTPSTTATTSGPAAPTTCTPSAVTSYAPLPTLDTAAVPPSIVARQSLRVGVSADSLLLGARNPLTNAIEGFDIDMAKAVAKAALGDENKIQLVVIQSADRIPDLQNRTVDMVARNMSMTCDRWNTIAFSAEYFQSGLKILVPRNSKVVSLDELKGKRVCAPNGTTTIDFIRSKGVEAVGAKTHTACLVLFQQGKVDAIAGDDTVLAGLVAQDPYAFVPKMSALTSEPYGLAFNKDDKDFVRFTNTLLDQMKADGRWKAIYDKWFAGPLGAAPPPPTSVYGRT
ncbi:MAG: glutamate ABC transporter substrate-binding protein [Lapillicoccus sp.]